MTTPQGYRQIDIDNYYNDFDDAYHQLYTESPIPGATNKYMQTSIANKMAAQNAYIMEQIKQHENITQYLTYSNELYRVENALGAFLEKESQAYVHNANKVTNNIFKIRQKYMDKVYYVFWYNFYTFFIQLTIVTILTCGVLMSFFVRGILGPLVYYLLLIAVLIAYTVYSSLYFSDYYRRNKTHNTRYDWEVKESDKESCPS